VEELGGAYRQWEICATSLSGRIRSQCRVLNPRAKRGGSEKAAIKLIPADAALAEKQLLRWEGASELTHPNLVRMFEAGHSELDGTALLYMVEEYAEENLSQVLPSAG